jgi:hypothetical protein
MLKLLLTIFLALSLVNQFKLVHSEREPTQVFTCVPGQANQALRFSSEFDDDQRRIRALPISFAALPFALVSPFAGRRQDGRQTGSFSDRVPLYKLNAVFLI